MNGRIFAILIAFVLPFSTRGSAQNQSPDRPEQNRPADVRLIKSIQGPALYKAYCASCHGTDAKGGGPMAKSLKGPPADLTRITARNGGTFPLMRIERIISGEEQISGGHGSREMPIWGPTFSQVNADQDLGRVRIDNIARYLRDVQKE